MDTDKMLCQCPACDFKQEFDWLQYNKNGECVECNKCHTHYRITSGIVYGKEMTEAEYKEWKFIRDLIDGD